MNKSANLTPENDFPDLGKNWEINSRYQRLKKAVEEAGSNIVVAPKAKVAASTLSSYLNGGEWKLSVVEKIADACGVSLQWLLFGASKEAEPQIIAQTKGRSDVGISYFEEAQASAGFGRVGVDAPKPQTVFISRDFLEELGLTPHQTIILKVAGDSMEPTLKTGDRLFLNTTPTNLLNGITVFVSSGQLMVKRLAPTASGTVRIIADNDRYPTEEAEISRFRWGEPDGGDAITIIGRVAYRLQAMS
ncbi:XRE family transcriptional regulator [Acetobacter oryzifermentans]|uniref:XRE family transcriptional regulator n=1 Tax=Acetobacter oryzifermentans TaxID=1633874 RepID=UPI0039BEFD60